MKYLTLFLLIIIFIGCESESGVSGTWQLCTSLQNSYLEALGEKCGEDIRLEHYNLIKTESDKKGEFYYCKEKYDGYLGTSEMYLLKKSLLREFPREEQKRTGKEYIASCEELKPYIGKRIEEEDLVLRMQMTLNNTTSCIDLNNIFKMELDDKCGDEAETLWNQHKEAWSNEKYYCEKYDNIQIDKGKKFPYRFQCLRNMDTYDCDKLKTMIGKEIENEIEKCFISN